MKIRRTCILLLLAALMMAQVAVAAVTPVAIIVSPDPTFAPAGGSVQFKATGYDAANKAVAVKSFTWSVSPSTAGTISKTGKFTAKGVVGECVISAAVGAVSGTADVTIVPGSVKKLTITPPAATVYVGAQQQFRIAAQDSFGNAIDTKNATWAAKANSGLSVEAGVVTAGAKTGKITKAVTASLGGKSISADITVAPVPPAAVVIIAPADGTIACSEKVTFSVEARDAQGHKLEGQVFQWKCDSSCGSLSSTKGDTITFTAARKPATGSIRVASTTVGSPTAQLALNIVPGSPKSVAITGPKSALPKNQTFQFAAKVTDSMGNLIPDAVVTWSLANKLAGSIDADTGVFTAGAIPGTYKGGVIASVAGSQVTKAVDVTVAPPSEFYIASNGSGESYRYILGGSGSVAGYGSFKISGDAAMSFVSNANVDHFGHTVNGLRLDIDLTLSAGGDSESGSGTAWQYYTQDADGAILLHGAAISIMGDSEDAWISDSPGYETYLASPLKVGTNGKWNAHMDNNETLTGSYSVQKLEAVQVPAGNFTALKVAVTPGVMGGTLSQTTWYSPELLGFAPIKISGGASMDIDAEGEMLHVKMNMAYGLTQLANDTFAESAPPMEPQREPSPVLRAALRAALGMMQ